MSASDRVLRAIYWIIPGALVGVGFIAILSIGFFLLMASVPLILLGALRGWWRELWAGLIGFGVAPMLMLLADLQNRASIQPASTADAYQFLAISFAVIAVAGLLAGIVVETRITLRHTRHTRQARQARAG